MVILGIILLVLGYVLNVGLLVTLGWIALAIGLVLFALGALGRGVGGRSHYW